ncbi:hypothetical protein KIF53_09555 [Chromobacterium subtsugae]|uniref:Uncharacterized protein n=1 Tax=Chromobacterium subtsugae TaxID=251747 RepID=A0ABS7FCP6_9NEIS|nr:MULTISPECIES: hypothetical protein [Chromobacterium]KUM04245.1 hypothetical protein Cv017_15955 [Chromobacterium subtsugae]KZE85217.1 hypothetical protein AWB61_20855 [Chromobacterium sp. F49]MBW7566272.1 hypothetical protein [Chromobacterium subtsugae]MBW8287869.1 hypothetical protein [Chromobacterium subtsugae]WSE91198.1 hypothetical protein U6115_20340 [Chromobacterium subtsugae]
MSLRQHITQQMHRRDQQMRAIVTPTLPPEMAARQNRTRQRLNDRAERMHQRADTVNGWS